MTATLQKDEFAQLSKWIKGRHEFTLLYKISRDGCNPSTFHEQCDNKGPTVTVLYNKNDTVYGGYTSVHWNSNSEYVADENAFLFQLRYNGKPRSMQYKIKTDSTSDAIYCEEDYGPTFGREKHEFREGHDLFLFSEKISPSNKVYKLNGDCSLNETYDMMGDNFNSFANGNLQVKEMEVYQITEMDIHEMHEKPWRKTPEFTVQLMKELKEEVEFYKPLKELSIPHANILLIGQVGAGKSSFFNTINSVFQGYITSQACCGTTDHSLTTQYRMYEVKNGRLGKPLNFRLCDTRGLEEDQGIDTNEVCYVLDGHAPDKYMFNPSSPLCPDTPGFVKSPKLKDRIHCVAFVLDASTVDVLSEKVVEKMKKLQLPMNQRGIARVVLLTKIDKISESVQDDVSKTYFVTAIQELVDRVALIVGLPRGHVLPVKNYENEWDLDQNINILALLSIQRILRFADNSIMNLPDEQNSTQTD